MSKNEFNPQEWETQSKNLSLKQFRPGESQSVSDSSLNASGPKAKIQQVAGG